MVDVSGLILTVIGLSYQLASTICCYSQDVKVASNSIQRLSNERFASNGVREHVELQRQQTIPPSPIPKGEYNNSESLKRLLEETVVSLQRLRFEILSVLVRLMLFISWFQASMRRVLDLVWKHLQI